MPQRPTQSERQAWWTLFALWALMGVAWALATPPVTGPDEVEQARARNIVCADDDFNSRSVVSHQIVCDRPAPLRVAGWSDPAFVAGVSGSVRGDLDADPGRDDRLYVRVVR